MKRLRKGFTTGTYATAATVAAWRCMSGRQNGDTVGVKFPDGRKRSVNIDGWKKTKNGAIAWATKDAGDDIDITDKAVIKVKIEPANAHDVTNADYVQQCGKTRIIIRAATGVGRSTRPGLDVPRGKWAINPVPRRMISDNLKPALKNTHQSLLLVSIGIKEGARLARKTLNPMLGVEGGLSVLGTSGIVIPCSNKAYIDTIRVLVRGATECGCKKVVFVTGGRTHRLARKQLHDLPEIAFIRIGDFIKESLQAAVKHNIKHVVVYCMPGKLAKYAQGHAYTHAHTISQSMRALCDSLRSGDCEKELRERCLDCKSVREYLFGLNRRERSIIICILRLKALNVMQKWAPETNIEIIVVDNHKDLQP